MHTAWSKMDKAPLIEAEAPSAHPQRSGTEMEALLPTEVPQAGNWFAEVWPAAAQPKEPGERAAAPRQHTPLPVGPRPCWAQP